MVGKQTSRYRLKVARASLILWILGAALAGQLHAQSAAAVDMGGAIRAGGEEAQYLRVLEIAGLAPLVPWSIQPFSPSQARDLRSAKPNPWSRHLEGESDSGARVLRPRGELIENSSFPYQLTDGPAWEGRGLTAEIQIGARARWKDVYAQLAPMGFLAQNAAFELASNRQTGSGAFGDSRYPTRIDAPQRFGAKSYGRLDPGESFLAVDARGLFFGASSAANQWGPGRDFQLVLGPNAGGFPSLFAGTSEPIQLWLFRLHARVLYGRLGQSAFAAPVAGEAERLGSGLVFDVLPRGVPGLEVGVARFIHDLWPARLLQLSNFERPFAGGLNLGSKATNVFFENQVASVFARWAVPAARAEFYGEFYKEDYPGPFHQAISLIESPDDLASIMLGFQHVLAASDSRIRVLHAELVNGETSHQQRDERGFVDPIPPYVHNQLTQGHTLNGLMLGAPDAYGGSGWRIGLDTYGPSGRRSTTFVRSLRSDWLPTIGNSAHPDVIYGVRQEWMRFGARRDYGVTLVPAVDLNRDLATRHDVFNLAAAVTVTGW